MNNTDNDNLPFPKGFLWGVSTSAHQIEGGNTNDWSVWESSRERLSDLKARGKNINEYISGLAANSWNLYEQDFDLIQDLGCGAYRLGVEWSRLEPAEGKFNLEARDHYIKMFKSLKARNIKVVLTLWHWTNPVWLEEKGGWRNRDVVRYFSRFTEFCTKEFGEYVDFWVVLNEPLMIVGHGYLDGKFPPNHKGDIINSLRLVRNYLAVQKSAYRIIHKHLSDAQVGLAMTTGYFDQLHPGNLLEKLMVITADYFRNFWMLNRLQGYFDYIGVNYYHHDRLTWRPPFKKNENLKTTDFGWEIFPEGIYHVLKNYAKYQKPLYITENGIADQKDSQRADFIKGHLSYILQAINEGADVRGYFHWSLLDNFEWADGYAMKFGLYQVDRTTFERIARPSATVYGEICRQNGLRLG